MREGELGSSAIGPIRNLCVDRIFTSSGGNCIAMGRLLLGQNVFLERADLAAGKTIKKNDGRRIWHHPEVRWS